jgi:hypothetical protein
MIDDSIPPPTDHDAPSDLDPGPPTPIAGPMIERVKAYPPALYEPEVTAWAHSVAVHRLEAFCFELKAIPGVSVPRFRAHLRDSKPKPNPERTPRPDNAPDFTVESVTVSSTLPRIYSLHLDGGVIALDAATLMVKARFKERFLEHFRRIPSLPKQWETVVNGWLSSAVEVKSAPESSEDVMIRRSVLDHVTSRGTSDSLVDIDNGKGHQVDQSRIGFRLKPLLAALRSDGHPKLSSRDLCEHLKALGCHSDVMRIEGIPTRLWISPAQWPDLLEEGSSAPDDAPAAGGQMRMPGDDDE